MEEGKESKAQENGPTDDLKENPYNSKTKAAEAYVLEMTGKIEEGASQRIDTLTEEVLGVTDRELL